MKRSRHVRLVLMSTVPLFVTACDDPPTEVVVFRSVEECAASGAFTESDCRLQIAEMREQYAREAPKFTTREECVAAYGPEACQQQTASTTTGSPWRSSSTTSSPTTTGGAPVTGAPTAEGAAAEGTTTTAQGGAPTTAHEGGGSFWLPMLAGYMMGRMGGYNQPVYGNPASNLWRTSGGAAIAPGTHTLPKAQASAFSSTGRTSAAVSRGGFGSRMSSSVSG